MALHERRLPDGTMGFTMNPDHDYTRLVEITAEKLGMTPEEVVSQALTEYLRDNAWRTGIELPPEGS
jgi:hypothetical protein